MVSHPRGTGERRRRSGAMRYPNTATTVLVHLSGAAKGVGAMRRRTVASIEDSEEWDEWPERLRAAQAQVSVEFPLLQEQLGLATRYRKQMHALRALADDLDTADAHARWVRLSDVRRTYDVRFANSTLVSMTAGVRSSWLAFVNSTVLALARTFAGAEEGTDGEARRAVAQYLDSGGAHYEAARARQWPHQCHAPEHAHHDDHARFETEAASAVAALLSSHVVRPHVLEAKAALCLWSNTLSRAITALTDYELSVGLPPSAPTAGTARKHLAALRRWCSRTAQADDGAAFDALARDGVHLLGDVVEAPVGSVEVRTAAAAMRVIATWLVAKRAAQRGQASRGSVKGREERRRAVAAQGAANEHNAHFLACWMGAHELPLRCACAREKLWTEDMIEATHTHAAWHQVSVTEGYGQLASAAVLQPPNHLGSFAGRKRVLVGHVDAATAREACARPLRTVPTVQLCAVMECVLERGYVSFGCVSAAYLLEAVRMDYATHENKLMCIRNDLRRLLPQAHTADPASTESVWSGISQSALAMH